MSERRECENCRPQYYEDEIDLSELFAKLWAGKWLILAVSLGLGLAVGGYVRLKPPVYEVKAIIRPAAVGMMADGSMRYIESPARIVAMLKAGLVKPAGSNDEIFAGNAQISVIEGTDYIMLSSRVSQDGRSDIIGVYTDWLTNIERFYRPRALVITQRQTLVDEIMIGLIEHRHKLIAIMKDDNRDEQARAMLNMAIEDNAANLIALQDQPMGVSSAIDRVVDGRSSLAASSAIDVIQPPASSGPVDSGAGRKTMLGAIAGFILACLWVLLRGYGKDGVA